MAQATGTLAGLNEFLSDTPTDITTVELRATLVANSISTMASELNDKLMQTPWLVDKKSEQQTITMLEALSRELERLLEIKRQLEAQQR